MRTSIKKQTVEKPLKGYTQVQFLGKLKLVEPVSTYIVKNYSALDLKQIDIDFVVFAGSLSEEFLSLADFFGTLVSEYLEAIGDDEQLPSPDDLCQEFHSIPAEHRASCMASVLHGDPNFAHKCISAALKADKAEKVVNISPETFTKLFDEVCERIIEYCRDTRSSDHVAAKFLASKYKDWVAYNLDEDAPFHEFVNYCLGCFYSKFTPEFCTQFMKRIPIRSDVNLALETEMSPTAVEECELCILRYCGNVFSTHKQLSTLIDKFVLTVKSFVNVDDRFQVVEHGGIEGVYNTTGELSDATLIHLGYEKLTGIKERIIHKTRLAEMLFNDLDGKTSGLVNTLSVFKVMAGIFASNETLRSEYMKAAITDKLYGAKPASVFTAMSSFFLALNDDEEVHTAEHADATHTSLKSTAGKKVRKPAGARTVATPTRTGRSAIVIDENGEPVVPKGKVKAAPKGKAKAAPKEESEDEEDEEVEEVEVESDEETEEEVEETESEVESVIDEPVAAPKAVAPKAVVSKAVAPKAVVSKAVVSKAVVSKAVVSKAVVSKDASPKAVAPKAVVSKDASPKAASPKVVASEVKGSSSPSLRTAKVKDVAAPVFVPEPRTESPVAAGAAKRGRKRIDV